MKKLLIVILLTSIISALTNGQSIESEETNGLPTTINSEESGERTDPEVTTEINEGELTTTDASEETNSSTEPGEIVPTTENEELTIPTEPESTDSSTEPEDVTSTTQEEEESATTEPQDVTGTTQKEQESATTEPQDVTGTTQEEEESATTEPQDVTSTTPEGEESPTTEPGETGSTEGEETTDTTEREGPTTPESENPETCIGNCPPVDGRHSVYLRHRRCDKFCQCSNGQAYVLSCPDSLHFNVRLNVCDWPRSANCSEEITTESPEVSIEAA